MPYLSMTRLKLKSVVYFIPFLIQTEQIVGQIKRSKGFLQGKLLMTPSLAMWTATLWESEEDLREFYLSGSHKKVMGKLSKWSSEAVSGHRKIDFAKILSWEEIR